MIGGGGPSRHGTEVRVCWGKGPSAKAELIKWRGHGIVSSLQPLLSYDVALLGCREHKRNNRYVAGACASVF